MEIYLIGLVVSLVLCILLELFLPSKVDSGTVGGIMFTMAILSWAGVLLLFCGCIAKALKYLRS